MKRTLLFSILLLIPFCMQAQFWAYFSNSQRLCIVDSTQTSNQFDVWNIYKTTNNEWDGTLDSTFCGQAFAHSQIDLSNFSTGETFFIRYRFNDLNKIWLSNDQLHSGELIGHIDSLDAINLGNNCNGNYCSSVITGIEIPDSAGTGTNMRWYETIPSISNSSFNNFQAHYCVPTENFANNFLREVIIKITVDNPAGLLELSQYTLEQNYISQNIKYNIDAYPNGNNQYEYYTYEHNLLIRSNSSIYPNSYGIEYIDLIPNPNIDTVSTINLIIDTMSSLIFQPFVEVQGAYILNSTTQRHNYNIINNGGNMCFPNFFEVVLKDGNHYIHKNGHVDFGSQRACMQFGDGSKLIVDDNARLDYGTNGVGNLALRSRSSIEIGKGSELHINNNMMLFEFKNETEPQQIYMTLNEGSKLSFGKLANITNEYSIDGTMKLNIYMKGGEVDLSQLDPESRALVNLIYDTPTIAFNENIKILGNPVTENIRMSIINTEATRTQLRLNTLNGQMVYNEIIELQKGYDEFEISTSNLNSGLYFLTIQSNDNILTEKIIIIK